MDGWIDGCMDIKSRFVVRIFFALLSPYKLSAAGIPGLSRPELPHCGKLPRSLVGPRQTHYQSLRVLRFFVDVPFPTCAINLGPKVVCWCTSSNLCYQFVSYSSFLVYLFQLVVKRGCKVENHGCRIRMSVAICHTYV